jgi:hypothetical protein
LPNLDPTSEKFAKETLEILEDLSIGDIPGHEGKNSFLELLVDLIRLSFKKWRASLFCKVGIQGR